MARLEKHTVVTEALDLLDEVGLDAVSTRRLAQRLGVEQPSLYWHFTSKRELLAAMAREAMAPHARAPLPEAGEDWATWFAENTRSLRTTLLARRDGARLHAGSAPAVDDLPRIEHKLRFLLDAGVPEASAQSGLLAASRFTVGSVLEQQADPGGSPPADGPQPPDHETAFEAGLALLLGGLRGVVTLDG